MSSMFLQQFGALFWKNFLLAWRNKRAALVQLFSSFFFILLMSMIQKATNESNEDLSMQGGKDHVVSVNHGIPSCEEMRMMKHPCYDFVWSGNESVKVGRLVDAIMRNNPGRTINPSKVKSFRAQKDVYEWFLKNPMRCPGALHFKEVNETVISYGIEMNTTKSQTGGPPSKDTTTNIQIPLQFAAEREIARSLVGEPNFGWTVAIKGYPHPAEKYVSEDRSGEMEYPTFFLASAMFGFVFQISSLVMEKELKLREAMSMMGLYDSAYWLSWLAWEGLMTILSALFIVLFGMMFQFRFFSTNGFLVVFFLFFLFQLSMMGFAFMLSAFISKSTSSTTVGFSVFIVGFFTQMLVPQGEMFSGVSRIIWLLFPPNPFSKGLTLLSEATSYPKGPSIIWSRHESCSSNPCLNTMGDVYGLLLAAFFVWIVLAIYLDNIIPNAYGLRKSVFYFLSPSYWIGKSRDNFREGSPCCNCKGSAPSSELVTQDDEDVLEEQSVVKRQEREGAVDPNVAVQIRGLAKTYPGTRGGCCNCKRTPPYHALKGLWVNILKDQLFCLLGPNGAGKTTAINCLIGNTVVTYGDALIYGHSIRSSTGMSSIRGLIGVCPQFDILWDVLSGKEHLDIFARIQGLHPASVKAAVQESLASVRLSEAANVRAGSYSGGMKRRLSFAIARIGDPKLLILDEPTTGMDPITRRYVWDIIEDAKKGRAILLTTHSMEEADILSDRIGIMAKGTLRCIGTSVRLKSRFGTGFIANVRFSDENCRESSSSENTVMSANKEAVKQIFNDHLHIHPKEVNEAFLTYIIPRDRESLLKTFFWELESREKEFGIADIQLSLTTLEEVFLNIARQAELETAESEGKMAILTLEASGRTILIPVGARFVGIPATESTENPRGVMVEVYWEQDDAGALLISNHSPEMSIPANVQLPTTAMTTCRRFRGQRMPVQGYLLDPNEVRSSDQ